MMRNFKSLVARNVALLFAVCITASLASLPVQADVLDDLRASGAIGERYDGFAEARDASAQGTVAEVNAKRRALYTKNALAQGVQVEQVGLVYAAEIFKRLPAGTWVRLKDGRWTRK